MDAGLDTDDLPKGNYGGDGGHAHLATLNLPLSLAFDSSGNLFVSDSNNFRIRKIDIGGIITTYVGTGSYPGPNRWQPGGHIVGDGGPSNEGAITPPYALEIHNNNLYFGDQGYIREVSSTGVRETLYSVGLQGDYAIDSAGQIFVARGRDVIKIEPDGRLTIIAGKVTEEIVLEVPKDGDIATNVPLSAALHLAIDAEGNLWVSDSGFNRIFEVFGVAAPGRVGGRNLPGNGDVNRDSVVNIADAVRALSAAVQSLQLNAVETAFADMNADGVLNIQDVTLILRRAVGL